MKSIIDGKTYNTESAKLIAKNWNGLGKSDFCYLSEELYKKKTGEFFIFGKGGARTKYNDCIGNVT